MSNVIVVFCFGWATSSPESVALLYDGLWAEGVEEAIWFECCRSGSTKVKVGGGDCGVPLNLIG